MIAEGMLILRPGIGTFVTPIHGLHTSLRQMESFTDSALSAGMVPETKVLCFSKKRSRELSALLFWLLKGLGSVRRKSRPGIRSSTTGAIDTNWKTKSTPAADRPGLLYADVPS